jgi:phosphohistidine phosphatase SixA
MKRLKYVLFTLLFLFTIPVFAQTVSKPLPEGNYYLVRHAEKDTGFNPVLTPAGYIRAGELYRELKNKKISKIYVSQFRRSQLTSDSLRIYKKTDTLHYTADTTGDYLMNKLALQKGPMKNVLIVGHSNTIPVIIKRLGITALDLIMIGDDEYDNLFLVTVKNKRASLKWLKYGRSPLTGEKPVKMIPLQ